MQVSTDDDPFSNHPPPLPAPSSTSTRSQAPAVLEPDSATMVKLPSTGIFVEHLEDATPLPEDMEAFDCFSPGSYISSRRQSVEWAGYVHPSFPNDGEYVLFSHHQELSKEEPSFDTPPISPTSPDSATRLRAHAYPHAPAGMPFAALVRRLSYTSSRLPAKYANRQYSESAHKRPKTSSGALLTSSVQRSDTAEENVTPIKTITEGHSGVTPSKVSNEVLSTSSKVVQAQHSRPVISSRPVSRRRTKSGEAVPGSPKSSVKGKGKGQKRPKQPLRSTSFMDDVLLQTPGNDKRNGFNEKNNTTAPGSPVMLAAKDPNVNSSFFPLYTTPHEKATGNKARDLGTPMTPDHEIEAQLAKHDFKRFLMPNLPTPPPTGHLGAADMAVSSDVSERPAGIPHEHSPISIGLRTPSPAPAGVEGGANVGQIQSKRASSDDRRGSKSFAPGWPWHRRNSNSSITSLLSPRLVGRQATSPSLSPSAGITKFNSSSPISVIKPALQVPISSSPANLLYPSAPVSESASLRLDRTPSPNLPLRTSPLSQLSKPALEADDIASPATPESAIGGRSGKSRPGSGVSRRSLSASFVNLGRKVASLGNSQAFESARQNGAVLSRSSETEASGGIPGGPKSTLQPKRRNSGIAPTPSPKTGIKGKEWPWKSHSHQQSCGTQSTSGGSPLSSASSPIDEVQWSFKVHGAYPATYSSPLASSSSSPSPVSSANGYAKSLHAPKAHSPIFVKSPLGSNAVQGDAYFTNHNVPEGPTSSLMLSSGSRNSNPLVLASEIPDANPSAVQEVVPDVGVEYLAKPTNRELLSPDRAVAQHQAETRFSVENRPRLYRNARSDDGGLAARSSASPSSELSASLENLSTSAPTAGRQASAFSAGLRSPIRQASPSPSGNLTKIPEADEQELQTRKESWLASLRGKPVASKRRMSAADIFGLPPHIATVATGLPTSTLNTATPSPKSKSTFECHFNAHSESGEKARELDFSKKAVNLDASFEQHLSYLDSPSRYHRASLDPSNSQAESQPLRSRAVSQSSLLSTSRPAITPGPSLSPSNALAHIRPFPVILPSQQHRHTQSMPTVPQLDHAAMHVSGLGAPESSVLNASQAKFARVLGAATSQAPIAVPASKPGARTPIRESVAREDKDKMRRLMTESREFENAIDDEEHQAANDTSETMRDLAEDQILSPEMHRTPKLSYATSSSADSHPSTNEPRTQTRARILDMGTPVRAGLTSYTGNAQIAQELVFYRSSPSNTTASSISNPNGPKNAFDILLSSRGLDSIDGLPQSRVASWARRDGSDDSEITMTSNGSTDDGRPRDIFDEGRVSVW